MKMFRPKEETQGLSQEKRPTRSTRLKSWYQASRPPFYIATLVPLFLGLILAHQDTGHWHWGRFALINLGGFMVHLATNLADDLFDHLLGADAGDSIGGSRVIQQGLISVKELVVALVVLYTIGLIVAVVLIHLSHQVRLWGLVIFAWMASFFYVAPPIKYGYRGLGELGVFISMGFIMVGGTYAVLAESWRWDLVWYSLPVGLMVSNILFFQSLPDMVTDRSVGKYTLAVRLGKHRSKTAFRLWWAATYAGLAGLYVTGLTGPLTWLCLATLPLFFKTDRLIARTVDWQALDRHGHLVRKLYLLNGIVLLASTAWNQ
jgi:1,4-dihydroxy-2-naphthoate polyprenyltransferase